MFGEQLIQKSEPLDAVLIEDELEELHRYCQEVFGRVSRFHRRLTSHAPVRGPPPSHSGLLGHPKLIFDSTLFSTYSFGCTGSWMGTQAV